jgi:hypothetical protein
MTLMKAFSDFKLSAVIGSNLYSSEKKTFHQLFRRFLYRRCRRVATVTGLEPSTLGCSATVPPLMLETFTRREKVFWRHNIQINDIQDTDTQHLRLICNTQNSSTLY